MDSNIPADESSAQVNSLETSALTYARRGWRVFPVHTPRFSGCSCGLAAGVCAQLGTPGHEPLKVWCSCSKGKDCQNIGKHPRTARGLNDATTVEDIIRAWWKRWPDANIGIATGKDSGIIVLDVDLRHGGDISLEDLEAQHGKLSDTVE